ncbi:MAG: ABC transporter permease [Oscillospiraceae bacterium]|nr:ABC transporter permease [Oscillospiraceae bacterium]
MNPMMKRNIKLYFRDKTNMFFSMLSVLIMVAVFALFLGAGDWGGEGIRDSWLMAGVMAMATLTTSLGAFSRMIEDKEDKVAKGFFASPIKRSHITISYIVSPFVVSVIMTTITGIAFGAYILATGGELPDATGILQVLGLILLSSITATPLVCFIVSFLKTVSAFGTISTIIGTLAGFLMGIYMPIGNAPSAVQIIMMLFPPSHAATLFRQVLMERPMELALYGAPAEIAQEINENLGVVFTVGTFEITPVMSIIYMIASAMLFFGLSAMIMRRTGK